MQASGTSIYKGYTVVVYRGGASWAVLSEMQRFYSRTFLHAWIKARTWIRKGSGVHAVSIYRGQDDATEHLVWSKESRLRRDVAVAA